jgi:hypothetical protein
MEIVQERTCPNCKNQITSLRIERKVEQYFHIATGEDWNDYLPDSCHEGEWIAICYATDIGEGCLSKIPFYAEEHAEGFMDGEVDSDGNEFINVKIRG